MCAPPRNASQAPVRPRPRGSEPVPLRSELVRVGQQLAAIEMFNRARREAEDAASLAAGGGELRVDADPRLEVLRRQHDALVHRSQQQLRDSVQVLASVAPRTAVLAHRDEWFVGEVASVLTEHGIDVVARLDNGADAIGHAVAEQPDLLLVEEGLAMVPVRVVLSEVLQFCPSSRVVAQVDREDHVGALLDAGAAAVFTRQVSPRDVGTAMCRLVLT